jgi:hypothetical protein
MEVLPIQPLKVISSTAADAPKVRLANFVRMTHEGVLTWLQSDIGWETKAGSPWNYLTLTLNGLTSRADARLWSPTMYDLSPLYEAIISQQTRRD